MSFFEFYKIPVSFLVDESALRRIYLQNSKQYHPDFHTLADEAEQGKMLELSTLNNEAFKTLSDPDLRIQYILKIKGLLGEEGTHPQLPQEFLLEMMDINESIMELEFDNDATRHALVLKAVDNFEKTLQAEVQPILDAWAESDGIEPLHAVRGFFLKKRYLLRIRENLSIFAPAN